MKAKREYSILSQTERDDFHHRVQPSYKSEPHCCIVFFLILVILLVLCIVVGLCVSLIYPQKFSHAVHHVWGDEEIVATTLPPSSTISVETTTTMETSSSENGTTIEDDYNAIMENFNVTSWNGTYGANSTNGDYSFELKMLQEKFAEFVRNTNDRWKSLTVMLQSNIFIEHDREILIQILQMYFLLFAILGDKEG